MPKLNQRSALITGAGTLDGFGFATAQVFAREGARVFLTDIDGKAASDRAASLRAQGYQAAARQHNVTDEASWTETVEAVVREFGRLDIVVNNAGVSYVGDIANTPRKDWDHHISVNLTGVFLGCQAAVRQMRAQNGGGAIINIASNAALSGHPNLSAYTASKGGVRHLSRSAALDVAREGIRINSVYPGLMCTSMTMSFDKELVDRLAEGVPIGRLGEPEDVAMMNLFLASDDARYVTGAEFAVDGGQSAL